MVRIPGPSDFNHSPGRRLGADGHRWGLGPSNRGGPGVLRQLFRLGVLLGLVVMVMRGASRPGVYEPFFGQEASQVAVARPSDSQTAADAPGRIVGETRSGTPSPTRSPAPSESETPASVIPASVIPASVIPGSETPASETPAKLSSETPAWGDSQLRAIVDSIPQARRGEWMAWLQRVSDPHFEGILDGQVDQVDQVFEDGEPTDEEIRSWIAANELVSSSFSRSMALEGLRRDAMDRVVDGSVFRAGDADALYDWLSQIASSSVRFDEAPRVGAIAMLQQPEVYRGQVVEVSGTIARSERVPAGENPFGVEAFFRLWVQPSVGANRPIVVITPPLGSAVPQEGRSIVARGVFFKRLAYRSGIGADLAPLVVGNVSFAGTRPSGRDEASERTAPNDFAMGGIAMGWWLAMALMIGIGIAAAVMASTRQAQRRLRAIRGQMPVTIAGLPNADLPSADAGDRSTTETDHSREMDVP